MILISVVLPQPDGPSSTSVSPAVVEAKRIVSVPLPAGQPWTATTWTLNSLREWGLDSAVLRERRTAELLAAMELPEHPIRVVRTHQWIQSDGERREPIELAAPSPHASERAS